VIRALAAFEETTIDFSRISTPTLVIYGENELGFIRQHAAKLGAELPNVTMTEVPNGGHGSNLDNPAFFSEALLAFLETVRNGESDSRW
jgi:pimeloyl-ACP methyl ester carboxylesterase